MNTSSSRYKPNFQTYDFIPSNYSQTNGILETIAKLSRDEKARLDKENLQEWRKNLKLIREHILR